jgi:hypothetical protein
MKIKNLQRAVEISQDLDFLNAQLEILKKVDSKNVWSMRAGKQNVIVQNPNKEQFVTDMQETCNTQIEILNNELTEL